MVRRMEGTEFIPVKIEAAGFADPLGFQGALRLVAVGNPKLVLEMAGFSGEVASHVSRFLAGDRSSIPTVYNMLEQMAEQLGVHLDSIRIYESGDRSVLRADLLFTGRDKTVNLEGYRSSDAIALASFYSAPILVMKSALKEEGAPHGSPEAPQP